jgi:glycosyltransferase involved in cell wall biosynthesis
MVHVNSWLPRKFWPTHLPVVTTVHHLVHDPAYRPFRSTPQAVYHELMIRPRELCAILAADAVTTVSEYVRDTVSKFSGRQDISVIHNWIDATDFPPAGRVHRGASDAFRLFMAGTASRRKGIDLLPRLAHCLGPGFEIRYAGGSKQFLDPPTNVIELGRLSEEQLINEYQQCDVVVSLSRYEGFGYTALEAAACGKPFLGFRTSGLIEVATGPFDRLVPIDDVQALACAAKQLRESRKASAEAKAQQRVDISERFSAANIFEYIEIYGQLLKKSSQTKNA